jgi:hypothetical protein
VRSVLTERHSSAVGSIDGSANGSSQIAGRRVISARIRSISAPGSMTAALPVFTHQTVVQFCCSGVTAVTNTPIGEGGWDGDWLILPT